MFKLRPTLALRFGMSLLVLTFIVVGNGTFAQAEQDRYWILWEKAKLRDPNCSDGQGCEEIRKFTSRLFSPKDHKTVERIFGALDAQALAEGRLAEAENAPRICQHTSPQVRLGFDPEIREVSDKETVLRGITTIGVDLTKLKAPPGHPSTFGQEIHEAFVARLEREGLNVVTPDQADELPGRPKFLLFFSFTETGQACEYQYSFFSTLTQTALLTRDLDTKVQVGVWSYMDKRVGADQAGGERALVLEAADALATAWSEANATQ